MFSIQASDQARREIAVFGIARAPVEIDQVARGNHRSLHGSGHGHARRYVDHLKQLLERPGLFVLRPQIKDWMESETI